MAAPATEKIAGLLRARLEAFLSRPQLSTDLDGLVRHLDTDPDWEAPCNILPVDEVGERVELIAMYERHWKANFESWTGKAIEEYKPFGRMQVASLMALNIEDLRKIDKEDELYERFWAMTICAGIWQMPALTKLFLTRGLSKSDKDNRNLVKECDQIELENLTAESGNPNRRARRGIQKSSEEDGLPVTKDGDAKRSDKQLEKRRALDNHRCIIMGTARPDICHIIPSSFNSTTAKVGWVAGSVRQSAKFLFEENMTAERKTHCNNLDLLFTSKVGVSDRKWNLISLEKQLHEFWGKPVFAFKYLGACGTLTGDPRAITTLKIQFHWLPEKTDKEHLTTEKRDATSWLAQFRGNYGDPTGESPLNAMSRPQTGRILKTGDIFYVRIEEKKAERMEYAFKIQWALLRLVAMAGGAEVVETEHTPPDYFDKYGQFVGFSELPAVDMERDVARILAERVEPEVSAEPAIDLRVLPFFPESDAGLEGEADATETKTDLAPDSNCELEPTLSMEADDIIKGKEEKLENARGGGSD